MEAIGLLFFLVAVGLLVAAAFTRLPERQASSIVLEDMSFEEATEDEIFEQRVRGVLHQISQEDRGKPWYKITGNWLLAGGMATMVSLGITVWSTFVAVEPSPCGTYLGAIQEIQELNGGANLDQEHSETGLLREFLDCGRPSDVLARVEQG